MSSVSTASQPAAFADVIQLRTSADRAGLRTLVLIPCLNEAPRVGGLVGRLRELHPGFDVLVVDDGSTDGTAEAARTAGAEILRLPHHLGYGAALQTGYKWALQHNYDRLIQMDGDGQHPVEEVQTLLDALEAEGADLVLGSRFGSRPCYRIPFIRLLGIKFFAWLTSRLVGRSVTDPTSGFQAMNRNVFSFYQQDFYPYDYDSVADAYADDYYDDSYYDNLP